MKLKTALQCSIMICIIGAFCYHLFFNKKGIKNYLSLKNQQENERLEITELKKEVEALNASLKDWNENPYAQERAAREDLHMTYTNERIYFIKKQPL